MANDALFVFLRCSLLIQAANQVVIPCGVSMANMLYVPIFQGRSLRRLIKQIKANNQADLLARSPSLSLSPLLECFYIVLVRRRVRLSTNKPPGNLSRPQLLPQVNKEGTYGIQCSSLYASGTECPSGQLDKEIEECQQQRKIGNHWRQISSCLELECQHA